MYIAKDPTITDDNIIDIGVGYNSIWHSRGDSSHIGVGTIQTGLVIDNHVMSNYCYVCARNNNPSNSWLEFARKTIMGRLVLRW